jgi:hypothetical protein
LKGRITRPFAADRIRQTRLHLWPFLSFKPRCIARENFGDMANDN